MVVRYEGITVDHQHRVARPRMIASFERVGLGLSAVRAGGQRRRGRTMAEIQYISDATGNPVGVIVPIEIWEEIESEKETAYLLRSDAMKKRLLAAKERIEGVSLENASAKLGI